jgi:hypothetical protein
MRFLLLLVTLIAWALWFGGSVATVIIGKHLFNVLPLDIAGQGANAMFHVFGSYELILSAIAITGTGFLLATYPSKGLLLALGLFILAAGMAIAFTLGFIPLMDSLIEQGKRSSPEFIRLHIKSMIALAIQTVLLLLNGAVILGMLGPFETVAETEPPDEEIDQRKAIARGL